MLYLPVPHGPVQVFTDRPVISPKYPAAQTPSQALVVRTVLLSPYEPAAHFAVHVLTDNPAVDP